MISCIAQGPRVEPNIMGKKKKMLMKWFLMTFCYTWRFETSPIGIREVSPCNCWKQTQRPQPNVRWTLRTPVEEGKERLVSQRDQGHYLKIHLVSCPGLMRAHGVWVAHYRTCMNLIWDLRTFVAVVWLGFLVGLLWEPVSDSGACSWNSFLPLGCLSAT